MTNANQLMVWIDRDKCMGDGVCEATVPEVFAGRDDLAWAVKEEAAYFGKTVVFDGKEGDGHGPDGSRGVARVPDSCVEAVAEAASQCLGEAITVVPYDAARVADRGA